MYVARDLLSGGDVPQAALSGRSYAGQQITRVISSFNISGKNKVYYVITWFCLARNLQT